MRLEVVDDANQTGRASATIDSVRGLPPRAEMVMPEPEQWRTAAELSFHGYLSSDDTGIASYEWDFGDGSARNYGPAVTHFWGAPGTYTVSLKVYDWAGQSDTWSQELEITGDAPVVAVPWRVLRTIELPHETWSGHTNVLKAVTLAGGFTDAAAKGKIRIVRQVGGQEQVRERVGLEEPVLANDVLVVPKSFF